MGPNLDTVKEIPTIAGWLLFIGILFITKGWRLCMFRRWLVLIPDLNGTWEGEIQSEWKDPKTDKRIPSKRACLVIRQTLFQTHFHLMTEESESHSRAGSILLSPDGNNKIAEFTYFNSPRISVQNKSKGHDGACSLKIIESPQRKLVGKYWTDRGTTGELKFSFKSSVPTQEFE